MVRPEIISDPTIMQGKPVIAGTSITVGQILQELAEGQTISLLLQTYPQLTRDALQAALEFAAESVRFSHAQTNETLIATDPKIMVGKPVIKGTRMTVQHIIEDLASGLTIDEMLEQYPHLNRAGIEAALRFAAESVSLERVYPLDQAVL